MNRQELIEIIAANTEASKAATTRFLDSFITTVQQEVAQGGTVKLTGFGVFEKAAVAARTGRNPRSGTAIAIPATFKPKFTPGAAFKGLVRD
jgi:DNA-binding protein HU-beta